MSVERRTTAARRTAAGTSYGEPGKSARVTTQFHDKRRMVYELDCDETRISLTMSAAPEPGEMWEIEATVRDGTTPRVLKASGPSRDEALTAVSAAWEEYDGQEGYRRLNWRAIHEALAAVRGV
jgi:hypothetical protein